MNTIELTAILYYADFLSMKAKSQPVTDNCKYFYIHGVPMNSAFILDLEPVYDEKNPYFQQAKAEYEIIRDKFGDDGVESFIDDICTIKSCGCVDGNRMLQCIHQFSSKKQRKDAYNTYYTWRDNQQYTHIITNEDGKPEERQCTKYTYHFERMLGKSKLAKNV